MRIRSKLLVGVGAVVGLVAGGSVLNTVLTPSVPGPFEQVQLPAPALPKPGVTVTPPPVPVTVTAPINSPAPSSAEVTSFPAGGCEPEWKKRIRRLTAAVGVTPAEAVVMCCPCYGGATVDAANTAKNALTLKSILDVVSGIGSAVNLVTKLSGSMGASGGNQFGTTSMPLAVPVPNLAAVTAIAASNAPASAPSLASASQATAWIASTLTTTATDSATVTAVAQRRDAAAVEAARYAYGLALNQRSDPTLAAGNAAFYNLGNVASTAVGQAGALGNAAASLAADAQHLTMMEEAALEVAATQAMRGTR